MGIGTAALVGGAISGIGSIASGIMGSNAADQAAQTQAAAAGNATALQEQIYQTNLGLLSPFVAAGQTGVNNLVGRLSSLTTPFQPTQAQLAATPGYQFTLQQGLQATQNAYAAQGLGSSGSALKGAANYAEGLAGTTYQQQFQNYLAQNQQIFNMLSNLSQQGISAGGALAGVGVQAGQGISNTLTSGAAAQAAGIVGSTNALTNALSGVAGGAGNTALLLALNNAGMFGGAGGTSGDFGGGSGA